MPALVNSRVGSSAGTSELEATRVWPFSSKKRRKASRISALFIGPLPRIRSAGLTPGKVSHYIGIAAGHALPAGSDSSIVAIESADQLNRPPVRHRGPRRRPHPAVGRPAPAYRPAGARSEEHTSELQ